MEHITIISETSESGNKRINIIADDGYFIYSKLEWAELEEMKKSGDIKEEIIDMVSKHPEFHAPESYNFDDLDTMKYPE